MTGRFYEITPEIMELANKCSASSIIPSELYTKYNVNRGLRDLNGKGVLVGLTHISDVCSTKLVNGEYIPAEGELYYRGYNVKDLVKGIRNTRAEMDVPPSRKAKVFIVTEDKELEEIFIRTYGPIKRRLSKEMNRKIEEQKEEKRTILPECLLVDGYNIIFSWDELNELSKTNLDHARTRLMEILNNYQGYRKCLLIVVFDAYKIKKNVGSFEKNDNIYVVYTKEAETADAYIEKTTYEISKRHRVRVATSDNTEQLIILGHGALRLSAQTFRQEVEQVQGELRSLLEKTRQGKNKAIQYALEKRGAKGNERG